MNEHNGTEKADATVEDVADHFGVSTRTIRRWVAEQDMPHRKGGGDNGALRFNLSEVDAWAARGGRKGAA
jgi:excisionase family DNA binding protein